MKGPTAEAVAVIQGRSDGDLDQKGLDSRCILKAESAAFTDWIGVREVSPELLDIYPLPGRIEFLCTEIRSMVEH